MSMHCAAALHLHRYRGSLTLRYLQKSIYVYVCVNEYLMFV